LIDDKNMGKMREMTRDLVATVFNDGWTVVNHHPIVNIIMGVRSLHTLQVSIDTMGKEKTMDFIAALILSALVCPYVASPQGRTERDSDRHVSAYPSGPH
jgi:hypothetical protein